jgi:hypothetical protein
MRNYIKFDVASYYLGALINESVDMYPDDEHDLINEFIADAYNLVPKEATSKWWSIDDYSTSFMLCEVSDRRAQCHEVYLNYKV